MSKKDNGGGVILAYLNEKNRPYSTQDVFSNLQKQHGFGKTAVVKAMELLAVEGKIKEKTYGKQKIYFADQSQFAEVSDADLKAMDGQISELGTQVQSIGQSCRQLDAELKALQGSLTTEEVTSEMEQLRTECSGHRARLQKIKSATKHITPEEKEKCSSIHPKTHADSSWKLLTDTELLNVWNSESMMLWKMRNLTWSDTCSSPRWGLFWWASTICS
ncbi:hypothetical protein CRUP_027893 [Coryphaenoides rupestris]|nr:hypothetical protein CRUP_027893 [Coryphaenoides rupestris]